MRWTSLRSLDAAPLTAPMAKRLPRYCIISWVSKLHVLSWSCEHCGQTHYAYELSNPDCHPDHPSTFFSLLKPKFWRICRQLIIKAKHLVRQQCTGETRVSQSTSQKYIALQMGDVHDLDNVATRCVRLMESALHKCMQPHHARIWGDLVWNFVFVGGITLHHQVGDCLNVWLMGTKLCYICIML